MKSQRRQFAEFAAAYHDTYPRSDVLFHYVDCTPVTQGYAPLKELDGWNDLRGGSGPTYGYGEVVWMANGRVVRVEPITNSESTSSLIQKTNRVF